MTRFLSFAVVALTAVTAFAQQPPTVSVESAWARATPPGAPTGAVYLTLTSSIGDRLVGASSAAAGKSEIHEMSMDGNIMRMRPVEGGLDLPAGKPVVLRPGGYHVMLVGLTRPLRQGQDLKVHLVFEKAAPIDVSVQVQPIGAAGPATPGTMPGMTMGK